MILSTASSLLNGGGPLVIALLAVAAYAIAGMGRRFATPALVVGWLMHLVIIVLDIGGWGQPLPGARLGFAPVLSMALWLVVAVYAVESRFVPLPSVRRWLALLAIAALLIELAFPGEAREYASPLAPLHFVLGVASYGLFGAALLHALMLDAADRRLRQRGAASASAFGMPLLQLEKLTFRFVEAGFAVLSATLVLGAVSETRWSLDLHKTVFSVLAWLVFAALIVGRRRSGWRGLRATRWLYAGTLLLLLAYVGSRFVFEVLLGRMPP
ncbi:MAG: cytochrome c biogenesis protein CcsA [Burkholderiales bacterium]|nr:cytochrome c biogenesis protein CcsA [Burkholderiales bacterium]MDE2454291.1 cytochrome c biogenesis protein CcsA [Burkholderiales bacterium]